MANEIWHKVLRHDIERRVDNPCVGRLCRDWRGQASPLSRPSLAQFRPERWPELIGHLMLLRRDCDGGFVFQQYGDEIARHSMRDLTGCRVSDIEGRLGAFFDTCCRDALADSEPIYTVHFSDRPLTVFTWEHLILPLRDDEGRDWLLVYGRPLELRHELLETVLDAASDALLVLRRLRDVDDQDLGWLCLVANPRFDALFEVRGSAVIGRLVHDVLPDWRLLNIEAECLLTMQSSAGRSITRVLPAGDGRLRYLQIQIGPLRDGVVLSIADTTELHEAQNRLRHLATTDALTGLANRREFDEHLRLEVQRARRSGDVLTLVMADIDAFKAYNDHYGHAAGDDCLRQFALSLRSVFARELDLVARYGGEEFAILLPGTSVEAALALVERLLALLRHRAMPHAASAVAPHLTASLGVAVFDRVLDRDELSLLRRADSALYQAKQTGRDRVCVVS
jgi:diguanylate cyclase (GGDEF)-like protein